MANIRRSLALVMDLIRTGEASTRPELMRRADLGRSAVNLRVEEAISAGLVEETAEGVSTGGRPSPTLRLRADRGLVLAANFGASRLHLAVADLAGTLIAEHFTEWNIDAGPQASLDLLVSLGRELLDVRPEPLWAVSVGLPGPVDFTAGRPVFPPIMAGWHEFPVRDHLEERFSVPAFVDNDANLMALGTWRRTRAVAGDDLLLVKAGTGLGAGIVSRGQLLRGARGAAGDFGHIVAAPDSAVRCRCGNYGCLDAFAGGWALARDGYTEAFSRGSEFLQQRISQTGEVSVDDIVRGGLAEDRVCQDLIYRAGTLIGVHLAVLVSTLNPATVFIGGSLARAGAPFLDAITEGVQRRALPLATERLLVTGVPLQHKEGAVGAATLALEMLFSVPVLSEWLDAGDPRHLRGVTTGPTTWGDVAARRKALDDISRRSEVLPLTP